MRKPVFHPPGRSSTTASAGGTADRGRGSAVNPANRFETISLDQLPAGGGDDDLVGEFLETEGSEADDRRIPTRVYRDRSRSIINPVDSPDLSFKWTINPYRGCEHGCVYCYARPTHETLGLSCGLDFETRLHAKMDAAALLRAELALPGWRGEPIVMSGVTDPYQPVERRLGITRACLAVMASCMQPVSIVTKSALVLRDLDLLADMARRRAASVAISLTTLDAALAAKMEPRAASPRRRLYAIRELASAGVPVSVMTAPIIPGLNDREIPALLEAAADAGATGAGVILLRLPYQVKEIFTDWLSRHFPDRASHVESLIRDTRGGELNQSKWGTRFRGEGPIAEQIHKTFKVFARRFGLDRSRRALSSEAFVRPDPPEKAGQMRLF